jgi:hypothetical protein
MFAEFLFENSKTHVKERPRYRGILLKLIVNN